MFLLSACLAALAAWPGRAAERSDIPAPTGEVLVAAAADLKFALDEVMSAFAKTNPTVKVKVTYGSSGNLFAQINQGAPFDLFLSADASFPEKLVAAKLGVEADRFLYAIGRLVVWVPKSSAIDVEKDGIRSLLDPSVKKIALANPAHAPYGRTAVATLKHYGVYEAVSNRLVLGENIMQAAQFVESGAADIGLLARSLAWAPKLREAGKFWEVPEAAHPRLEQGGLVLSTGRHAAIARRIKNLLTGADGRAVLARHGFALPDQ